MPTLVLSRRFSEDSNAMWRAAVAAGWAVERLMSYRPPADLAERQPVLYGETLLIDAVSEELGLELLQPDYAWLPRLPEAYRQREVRGMHLAAARQLDGSHFVKPVDEKLFRSQVYSASDLESACEGLDGRTSVLISQVVEWQLEIRAFILDRQLVTLSAYLRAGELAQDASGDWPLSEDERDDAERFIHRILEDPSVELPPALVLDVGTLRRPGEAAWSWAVVEANPAWASGLCGCDPNAVLPVLHRASVPAAQLPSELARWARSRHG